MSVWFMSFVVEVDKMSNYERKMDIVILKYQSSGKLLLRTLFTTDFEQKIYP